MQDSLYWIVDNVPTIENRTITGCRLPTERQILFCLLAFHRIQQENEEKKTVPEALDTSFLSTCQHTDASPKKYEERNKDVVGGVKEY